MKKFNKYLNISTFLLILGSNNVFAIQGNGLENVAKTQSFKNFSAKISNTNTVKETNISDTPTIYKSYRQGILYSDGIWRNDN